MAVERIEAVYESRSYAIDLSDDDTSQLNTVLTRYFGDSISANKFDTLLRYYGITETGVIEDDVRALYEAIKAAATGMVTADIAVQQNKMAQQARRNKPQIPWENLMKKIGLETSGDLRTDKTRFDNQIRNLQQYIEDDDDVKFINDLLAQAGMVFVSMENNPYKKQAGSTSANDVLSLINKQFFFGGNL